MDSSWKNCWRMFFFLSELSPFLELCPFEKIRTKSDACHILWTVHARVLKFHIWISHGKIADLYFFFLSELSPFLELYLFEKIWMKFCQQDISKSIWARGLKLGQLIGDDRLPDWILKKNSPYFSRVMALWKFGLFKRTYCNFLLRCAYGKGNFQRWTNACTDMIKRSLDISSLYLLTSFFHLRGVIDKFVSFFHRIIIYGCLHHFLSLSTTICR